MIISYVFLSVSFKKSNTNTFSEKYNFNRNQISNWWTSSDSLTYSYLRTKQQWMKNKTDYMCVLYDSYKSKSAFTLQANICLWRWCSQFSPHGSSETEDMSICSAVHLCGIRIALSTYSAHLNYTYRKQKKKLFRRVSPFWLVCSLARVRWQCVGVGFQCQYS